MTSEEFQAANELAEALRALIAFSRESIWKDQACEAIINWEATKPDIPATHDREVVAA